MEALVGWGGAAVWTDHKNLEYICSAKQLNSHQSRWALFFNCFNFFPLLLPLLLIVLCPTSPWILSLDCLRLMVTLPYSQLLTVSLNLPTSLLYPSYPLLKRLLSTCYNTFSICMVSPEILSLTGDHSSPLAFGISFFSWEPLPAWLQGSIPSRMANCNA